MAPWRWRGGGRRRTGARLDDLSDRLERVERRLDDVEDTASALLGPDRLDTLEARLDDLALSAATTEELLELRLAAARTAVGVARLADEVQSGWRGEAAAG
jgi:hypothetical protein